MAKFKNTTTGQMVEQENRNPQDLANQGFVPVSSDTINSNTLQTSPTVDFKQPETPTVFPVSGLDATPPKLELTQPETQAQGLSDEIRALTEGLVGESEFRTQQEEAQGLPDLLKTQTDLASQLKALQNEAKALPLQLQQDIEGRGVTAGGLRPLQTAALRKNAIQALTTSSLLEASRGNISTAQTLVDRAVAAKFDPIREEIATKKANLQMIIDSPEFSVAEKNRANEQLRLQEAEEKKIADAETEDKAKNDIALTAAENGANSQILKQITDAETKEEALIIATDAGIFAPEVEEVKPDLQFISGTKTQQAGVFNKQTGEFTPIGGYIGVGGSSEVVSAGFGLDDAGNIVSLDEEVASYVKAINDGRLTTDQALGDINKNKKADLMKALANTKTPEDTSDDIIAKEKSQLALSLKDDPGLNSAVGTSFLTRGNKLNWWDKLSGNTQEFIGKTEKLLSGLSLESLIEAKSRGATFGALSEREMQILSSAATTIGTWRMTDDDGNVTGYNVSEKAFKEELDNISKVLKRGIKSSITSQDTSETDPLGLLDTDIANSTNPLGI